jgi:hypothetical protein
MAILSRQLERELTRTCTWTPAGNTWRAACGSVYGFRQGAYCPACGGRIGEAGK